MRQGYQVTIEGRLLQGEDHRVLLKRAVEVKRRLDEHRRCRQCGRVIRDPALTEYRLCFSCVERAVNWYADALVARHIRQPEMAPSADCGAVSADVKSA